MESTFYLKTNFSDGLDELFLDELIKSFYNEIDEYLLRTKRKHYKYHISEYGEMTMVNFFINGVIRNDQNEQYTVLNEFGIEKIKGNLTGRADIIIEDIFFNNILYIEAKKLYSNEDAPKSNQWQNVETDKYYNSVLNQSNKYLLPDKEDFKEDPVVELRHSFYKIALIFDSVIFKDNSKICSWCFNKINKNEFYSFKTYLHNDKTYGLACYGKIEKI